jgi:AcrR family transcriptional regulator
MEMKERILLKARELFQQYGVKSITMDEIASQLGVSKKTIYQFFSDKDDLVLVVFSDFIDKIEAECSSLKNQFPNAILEVVNLMHYVLDLFSRINPVMLYDLKKFHPKAYQVFLNYKNEFLYNSIVANLKRGIEEGVYRKNLNVDILAKFRIESIELAFDQQLFPAGKYNLVEVQKVFIESYLFGISSLEGHKMISDYLEQQKNFRS